MVPYDQTGGDADDSESDSGDDLGWCDVRPCEREAVTTRLFPGEVDGLSDPVVVVVGFCADHADRYDAGVHRA